VTWAVGYVLYIGALLSYTDGTIWTLLQHLTPTQNVGVSPSATSWNTQSWSISVEFWINILFLYLVSTTTLSYLLVAVAVAALLIVYSQSGDLDASHENYFHYLNSGLLRGLASFFLGVIACRAYRHCLFWKPPLALASVIEVVLLLAVVAIFYFRSSLRSEQDLIAPFLFCVVVVIYSLERGTVSHLFSQLKWLGDISYSVYLNHFTVIWLLLYGWQNILGLDVKSLRSFFTFALYLILVVAYSKATDIFIEKPAQLFLRKTGARSLKILRTKGWLFYRLSIHPS